MKDRLYFCDRAEFHRLLDLCNIYEMSEDEIKSVINAYWKAYATGIIDNLDYIVDKADSNNYVSYKEFKDELIDEIYNIKYETCLEYFKLID